MNRNVNALMALVCLSMSLVMTGCGKDSSDDITQLGAVTGLTVTAGDSQNTLTWDALEGAVSYNIYWEEASTARTSGRVADCSGDRLESITDIPHTHTGLANGVEYNYRVTGVDADGNEGECGVDIANGTPVASSGGGSGSKPKPAPTVNGCTDPTATNYNPAATVDDGSCTYDTTPPVTTVALAQVSVTVSSWTGSATIDEAGTGYCTALATGSLAPTAAEVKANSNANKVGIGGTVAMTANVTANCQVTGLAPNTTYDFYFVAEDTSTNLQLDAAISGPVTATTTDPLIASLIFTDPNLATCVNTTATANGWTRVSQMNNLDCSALGIVSIAGIEQLTALTKLYLNDNQIVDVTPLAGLTSLTTLYIWGNQIVDVTPLSGFTALRSLVLDSNQIVDVTPLAGLTALTTLGLGGNQIVDLTPLAGLTALTWLNLGGNQIVDVTPLAGMTALTFLLLSNNQIVDVTPLAGLTALTRLYLSNNLIGGQLIGRVDLLSPAAGAFIYLSNNLGQSCAELGTLLTNYPGRVDLDGNGTVGGVGDVATNGVTCTNP